MGAASSELFVGNGVCKQLSSDEMMVDLRRLLEVARQNEEGVTGGNENATTGGVFGGKDVLQDYGNSVYSKAKETLIRNIAEDVFKALKLHGSNYAKTAPIDKVLEHLAKVVPNPSKGGKFSANFNKNAKLQKDVVDVVAVALNKHYGSSVIDVSSDAANKVQKVGEVMHSLMQGMHSEFMNVAGDTLRVLRNMQTLNKIIDASYKKQKELVEASGDSGLKQQSEQVKSFYDQLSAELQRQMVMISNMLDVSIGPAGTELIGLLESNKDFQGMVQDLGADVGTEQFSAKIAHMLSGVSSVAHSAAIIKKALTKLGVSVAEFKNAKSPNELRMVIYDNIQKRRPESRELDQLMAAADIVYRHDYDHNAIAKKITGGEETGATQEPTQEQEPAQEQEQEQEPVQEPTVDGGEESDDELPAYWSKKSLSKKIKKKEKYRGMLLKDFNKVLKAHYRVIVNASDVIARNIGKTIPVNDDLDRFIHVFGNLPLMNQENLHVALSGYAKDAASKNRRETFMNSYNLVGLAIEPLTKGPGGQDFNKMRTAIKDCVKAIDNFSDNIVNSLTEIHIDRPEEISAQVRGQAKDFFGSADGGDHGELGSNSFVEFERVKTEMTYKYSIAHIKTNLSRVATEMEHFGKDYETVLGEEAGWLINTIKQEYSDLIEHADPDCTKPLPEAEDNKVKTFNEHIRECHNAFKADGGKNAYKANVILWKKQRDAKIKMVEVAQAVDLYLRSFADGIARHPDAVGSVVKMLDQVELVAKWFNDRSGDNLAGLFEVFPNSVSDDGKVKYAYDNKPILADDGERKQLPVAASDDKSAHYYQWLAEQKQTPGNPTIGLPVNDKKSDEFTKGLLSLGEKTVKSMRALENIISTFATVGSKFGNLDPASKTFMNPGQISNALCDYIISSAFTTGFAAHDKKVTSGRHTNTGDAAANGANVKSNSNSTLVMSRIASDVLNNSDAQLISDVNGLVSGVSFNKDDATQKTLLNKMSAVAMASIPNTSGQTNEWKYHDPVKRGVRVDLAGWNDRMFDTDKLFMMTIKSIVCKVFTVVDAYRLFNRPTIDRSNINSLNPLRTILGGASKNSVKIIPDAIELYMRLPLLAEWYRERFGFDSTPHNTEDWRLSIVPSVDGIWSDFIKLIFDQAKYVSQGNYTETQVQRMIEAINQIHKSYKTKYNRATSRNILNSFAMEMNRIFGFLKQKDIETYNVNKRKYLDASKNQGSASGSNVFDNDPLNYDILNADEQFGRNAAPSDKFITVADKVKKGRQRNAVQLQEEIEKLRKDIDTDFANFVKKNKNVSFKDTLRSYVQDVSNARGEQEQYNVILNMVQGANQMINADVDKLIMLHESVAAPLLALHNTYRTVDNFNTLLHGTSFENIVGWLSVTEDCKTANDAVASYKKYLNGVYKNANPEIQEKFAYALLGEPAENKTNNWQLHVGNFDTVLEKENFAKVAWSNILRDQLAAIMDLASNSHGLVTVNVGTAGNINVDLSRLQDMSLDLLESVKNNINKLRLDFAKTNLLQKYEEVTKVGSVAWLEEHMVQVLFRNRDGTGLDVGLSNHLQATIKRASSTESVANGGCGITMAPAFNQLIFWDSGQKNNVVNTYAVYNENVFPFSVTSSKIPVSAMTQPQKEMYIKLNAGKFAHPLPDAADIVPSQSGQEEKQREEKQQVPPPVPSQPNVLGGAVTKNDAHLCNSVASMPVLAMVGDSGTAANAHGHVDSSVMNSWKLRTSLNSSLLLRFNNIVHRYLQDNMDNNTKKFYMPLIESFMNGPASIEVIQNKALGNVFDLYKNLKGGPDGETNATELNHDQVPPQGIGSNVVTGRPPANIVLFQSSVMVMKKYATSIDTLLKKKLHSYESITEIPEYMKERMRSNLPYYSKLFDQVFRRSDLLRRILSNTKLKNNIGQELQEPVRHLYDDTEIKINGSRQPLPGGMPLEAYITNSEDNFQYLVGLLNRLTQLSRGIKQCNDGVHKELQDTSSYFMDVHKDFSKDYKQQHGMLPLMPASNVLMPQNSTNGDPTNWETGDNTLLLPTSANGSNVYKFNYASRLLLARNDIEPQMAHMPGAVEVHSNYLRSASSSSRLPFAEYSRTILTMVKLARFLNDGASHGRLYAQPKAYKVNKNTQPRAHKNKWQTTSVYQGTESLVDAHEEKTDFPQLFQQKGDVDKRLESVINLAENPNYDKNKELFATFIKSDIRLESKLDRAGMRTANILDMNIVPVNVHAFMREVPFVNILNYSYTFDRMVHEFILPDYLTIGGNSDEIKADNLTIKANTNTKNPRDLMVKLLMHPYANLFENGQNGKDEYYNVLGSLFNGNDNFKLGRPRYLSDQLWHKALLSSSVDNLEPQQVQGPRAYQSHNMNAGPNENQGMKYFDNKSKKWVATTDAVDTDMVKYCGELGVVRFNTKLVRNLTWLVQLQRVMRVVMTSHLDWVASPVVKGLKIINPVITEYNANDQFDEGDFNGAKYEMF